MKTKTILITLILAIGFSFPSCDPYEAGMDCSCPRIDGEYFDIQDIEAANVATIAPLNENDTINFDEYRFLQIDYLVEYHSSVEPTNWSFSLLNSAYACSCIENGMYGSKTEKLENLTLITLNDFDDTHLANDTINDLFEIQHSFPQEISDINEYLMQDTSLIQEQALRLFLKRPPSLNPNFQVKLVLELSTNEIYEATTTPIVIRLLQVHKITMIFRFWLENQIIIRNEA